MISLLRLFAVVAAGLGFVPDGMGQTGVGSPFHAAADAAVRRAADSLALSPTQRTTFFANIDTAVAIGLTANPAGGRPTVDSAVTQVVRETGRKLRFVRQARAVFSDMFARRAHDPGRRAGTEEQLWRSAANVTRLIELYRDNPDASDHEMERAMAAAFKP